MSAYLFDTSALAKHYHPEVGSSWVDALLATSGTAHFVSRLSAVEIHSVLAKKVREGVLSSNDLERIRRRFLFDVNAGRSASSGWRQATTAWLNSSSSSTVRPENS